LDDGLVGHAYDFDIDIIESPGFGIVKTEDNYVFLVVYNGEEVRKLPILLIPNPIRPDPFNSDPTHLIYKVII